MLPVSSSLMATIITGALRLGREAYTARLKTKIDQQDVFSHVYASARTSGDEPEDARQAKIDNWLLSMLASSWRVRERLVYPGMLLEEDDGEPVRVNGLPQVTEDGLEKYEQFKCLAIARASQQHLDPGLVRGGVIAHHAATWNDPARPSPYGRFFRHVVDVGFDVVAAQPSILAGGGGMEGLLKAMAPNLALTFDAEEESSLADLLRDAFVESAMDTLVAQPGLMTSEERWKPFITDVLTPLQQSVKRDGVSEALAAENLRQMIRGPMASGALKALDQDADSFFKGSLDDKKIVGQMFREVLSVFADPGENGMTVRKLFSQDGAVLVLNSALKVAQDRPDMFMKADNVDDEVEYGRMLISRLATTLMDVDPPSPFGQNDGFGAALASTALDVVGQYTVSRMHAEVSDHDSSVMGVDVAEALLNSVLTGFNNALAGKQTNPFETLFTRSQAMDVMKIVSEHVASAPHILLNKKEDPAVIAVAQAVASAIAADDTGLMNGEDWRGVVVVALDTALQNPGRLFGLDDETAPEQAVAVQLITSIMASAKTQMAQAPNERGRLMFGDTLAQAVRVALAASASGVLAIAKDRGVLTEHLDALNVLMTRLTGLASSDDPTTVIGAAEWLDIFTFHVAHVLETGAAGPDAISDEQLLAVLSGPPVAT